jgi:hypothetical protein
MKIQDPLKQHPPFDIAAGQWQLYKSQGYSQVVEVTKPEPVATVNWFVRKGPFTEDYENPPYISFSTSEGNNGYVSSTKGTANKTAKVYAGGRWFYCPEHVGEEYVRLFAVWKSKSRKKPAEQQVSPSTPKHILQAQADALVQAGAWRRDVELRNR